MDLILESAITGLIVTFYSIASLGWTDTTCSVPASWIADGFMAPSRAANEDWTLVRKTKVLGGIRTMRRYLREWGKRAVGCSCGIALLLGGNHLQADGPGLGLKKFVNTQRGAPIVPSSTSPDSGDAIKASLGDQAAVAFEQSKASSERDVAAQGRATAAPLKPVQKLPAIAADAKRSEQRVSLTRFDNRPATQNQFKIQPVTSVEPESVQAETPQQASDGSATDRSQPDAVPQAKTSQLFSATPSRQPVTESPAASPSESGIAAREPQPAIPAPAASAPLKIVEMEPVQLGGSQQHPEPRQRRAEAAPVVSPDQLAAQQAERQEPAESRQAAELPVRVAEVPASPTGNDLAPAVASRPQPKPLGQPAQDVRRTQPEQLDAATATPLRVARRPGAMPAPVTRHPLPQFTSTVQDGPFQVIEEAGEMSVQVRRSKLLRTEKNIYRTAVVDATICEIAQFTPREVSVIGKAQGATHVTFWFEGGDNPVTYLIKVTPDVEEVAKAEKQYRMLEEVINDLFPDSKVRLIPVADKLIVRGQAKDAEEATQIMTIIRDQSNTSLNQGGISLASSTAASVLSEDATGRRDSRRIKVVNMLEIPGIQQVALRVKIAELNRSAARGFGVDVDAAINTTAGTSNLVLQSLLNAAAGNAPALIAQFDGDDINVGIRYLQQHGVLRLLSEPTLVTLSGRPATFVAGGEFAVPTVVGNVGLNAVTTDFRAFGVIISFVPTVVDKDRVRLEVAPEFSQINQDLTVNATPGLNVRAVTTTVEMREGQTLAIAGLLEDTMTANSRGDLPLVSRIFGQRDVTHNETELIILVTPELVQPMEPEEVPPLPGFDVTEPTGQEFFLHGQLEGDPTRDHRSTVWPRLRSRYKKGGPSMISGPFGHGQ